MSISCDQLFNILYHPVGYAHSSQLPTGWDATRSSEQPLLNYWLGTHYQLTDLPEPFQRYDALTSQVLTHWYQLPTITHLLGGYLLRSILLHQGLKLFMDPHLLAFITLPLIHYVSIPNQISVPPDTQAYGVAFILSQCSDLPHALQQRLLLQFPVSLELPALSALQRPEHGNLFRMAINYANRIPRRTA